VDESYALTISLQHSLMLCFRFFTNYCQLNVFNKARIFEMNLFVISD